MPTRWLDSAGSTNDLAREAALAGEVGPLWLVARRQTAGRGRQGRSWESPVGNFHGSLLVRTHRPLADAATLSLVAALTVAETIDALSAGAVRPRLKWPNDLLLDGAKLAGILLEGGEVPRAAADAHHRTTWVVIGIGVNLANRPELVGRPTCSLAEAGLPGITPEAFLDALAAPLAARIARWDIEGFPPFRQAWLAAAEGLGAPVRLRLGSGERRGRFLDLGPDGAILIATDGGRAERFTAGELLIAHGEAAQG